MGGVLDLHVVIGVVFRAAGHDADEAFVQRPEMRSRLAALPRHRGIRIERRRLAAGVLHAVGDGEHVFVVDGDGAREDQPGAVVPFERHGMAGRQRCAALQRPHAVLVGDFGAAGAEPADVGVIGIFCAVGREQHDLGILRILRAASFRSAGMLVVAFEAQVVEARALQREGAVDRRRLDRHALAGARQRLAARQHRRRRRHHGGRIGGKRGLLLFLLGELGLALLFLRLLRLGDEELPAQHHGERKGDGKPQIAIVGHVRFLRGGTGSSPDAPPSQVMGWQRSSRRAASPVPRSGPWTFIASTA